MPTFPQNIVISKELLLDPDWLGEQFSPPMAKIDLLLLAEDGKVTASYRELAKRWKWSVTRVMRFIDELEVEGFAKRFVGEFHGCRTKHIICIISGYCESKGNDSETFHETFQKNPPLSPQVSPGVPPTPPSSPLSPPLYPPQENSGTLPNARTHTSTHASTHANALGAGVMGAGASSAGVQALPPAPFPNPFILSSVERSEANGDPMKIVMFKRMHLAKNLEVVAAKVGMDRPAQEAFLDYWCSRNVYFPSEIRAEGDKYFDIFTKAKTWMKVEKKQCLSTTNTASKAPTRIEQYLDTSRKTDTIISQYFANNQNENDGRADDSSAGHPDDQ